MLRTRLSRRLLLARSTLFGIAGYALLAPIILVVLGLLGAFKGGISSEVLLVGAGSLAIAVVAIVAASAFKRRASWAFPFALVFSVGILVVSIVLLVGIGTGALPVVGNPAVLGLSGALLYLVLSAILVNHLVRWALSERVTGPAIAPEITAEELPEVAAATLGLTSTPVVATAGPDGAQAADASAPRVPLVAVRDLKKHFPIYGGLLRRQIGTVYAVDGVDFDIFPGEIFSLVGESGCGKTTLGRTLLQLTPPTSGQVVFDGFGLEDVDPDDMRPLRRRMQIVFQDPFGSLNPRMPISDIIGEGLLAQGMNNRKERDKKVEDTLEIVGLRRDYTRRYPHEFSGGQRQRVGIARALALGPDFIVCDEPVSALDVSIQSQVLNLLLDLRRDFNLTYLFISHNLSVVQYFSDRVGVMYLGKIVEIGSVEQLYRQPRHPYTVALLSAIPSPDPRRRKKRLVLKGDVPSPAAPPSGCRFHTRCWLREKLGNPERCVTEDPELRRLETGHRAACHFAEEISQESVEQVASTQTVETAVADPV